MSPTSRRTRTATLALGLALVLAGCSEQRDDGDRPEGAPPSSSAAAATPTPSKADTTAELCQLVSLAAGAQSFSSALAIAKEEGPALRASVAETYTNFADTLRRTAALAPVALRQALTDWALVSVEVAQFVATHKPRRGYVLEFGPAEPRWEAARKVAEKVCGHPLPNTR